MENDDFHAFCADATFFLPFKVKEIQKEAYTEPETVQEKDVKQTAAADLSKRLKDLHSLNDAASLKGISHCPSPTTSQNRKWNKTTLFSMHFFNFSHNDDTIKCKSNLLIQCIISVMFHFYVFWMECNSTS